MCVKQYNIIMALVNEKQNEIIKRNFQNDSIFT